MENDVKIKKEPSQIKLLQREIIKRNKQLRKERLKQRRESRDRYIAKKKRDKKKKYVVRHFMEVMEGLLFIVPADQYFFKKEALPPTEPEIKIIPVAPPLKTKSFEKTRNFIEEEPKEVVRPPAKYSNPKAIDKYL